MYANSCLEDVICRYGWYANSSLEESVICIYGCVNVLIVDRGELDAHEAKIIFSRIRVNLSLTTTYNPTENGKVEWQHGPILKAWEIACHAKMGGWLQLLLYALWVDKTIHVAQSQDTCQPSSSYIKIQSCQSTKILFPTPLYTGKIRWAWKIS